MSWTTEPKLLAQEALPNTETSVYATTSTTKAILNCLILNNIDSVTTAVVDIWVTDTGDLLTTDAEKVFTVELAPLEQFVFDGKLVIDSEKQLIALVDVGDIVSIFVSGAELTALDSVTAAHIETISMTFGGSGEPIPADQKVRLRLYYGFEVLSWTLLADAATDLVIDIWSTPYASYPPTVADTIFDTDPDKIQTSADDKAEGNVDAGWLETVFASGDTWIVNIDSCDVATEATLILKILRT